MSHLSCSSRRQRGTSLVVGLIMLGIITLLVTSAFTLSSTNLKAVGNMQFRSEATAAAVAAIEETIDSMDPATGPISAQHPINLNNDATSDYIVNISGTCLSSIALPPDPGKGKQSDWELSPQMRGALGSTGGYLTMWDIKATVSDSVSGASVVVHQAVRKVLSANCT